jgi:LacI family transcriptional regulator
MIEKRKEVALLVEWSRNYGRGALKGIGHYVQVHGRWNIYHTERKLSDSAPTWLKNWKGDGIIVRIENPKLMQHIERIGVPTVNLFEPVGASGFPSILTNDESVARLAADHLIEQGFEHFAYCGLYGVTSSDQRSAYFAQYLATKGHEVIVYDNKKHARRAFIPNGEESELRCENVTAWIASLPRPVGLMACNDVRAHQIIMACAALNIAVPEEVAVIGVDNDEVVCELSWPPLTSIELDPAKVGFEAASLLDRLMRGVQPPCQPTLIEPACLLPRQSTDIVATADTEVAEAIHFIRKHACDGIQVGDVLKHLSISRSTLERRFSRVLKRSPKQEIVNTQLRQVKQLLARTDYSLAHIAKLTGFRYVESMCCVFKRTTGRTPGKFRRSK